MNLAFEKLRVRIPGRATELVVEGNIGAHERVVLQGPSGCGKTTLLRVIAGLADPLSGRVMLGERAVTDAPLQTNGVGLVFQGGALFPHLTALENVAFGLRYADESRDWSDSLRAERALAAMKEAGLEAELAARPVSRLSGGERQRVALLRTLLAKPRCLLLDEPLSAVDPERRGALQDSLVQMLERAPRPTLIVTHDAGEAQRLGTRVIKWKEGESCLVF